MTRSTMQSRTSAAADRSRLAGACLAGLLLLSAVAPATAETAAADMSAAPLKLCLDPDNLPFSSADPKTPGLYGEIGALVGRSLGRPVQPVWGLTYFGKRMVRTTLLERRCDASIGLPDEKGFMGPKVIFSKPLFSIGYALVLPAGAEVHGYADLAGKRVGVQFNSGPQNLLATRDAITSVTFLEPQDAMAALAAGQVDAAFIWGPVAGYLDKTVYAGRFRVVPVAGEGLQWPAAVGFAKANTALRDAFDAALTQNAAAIAALLRRYGVPSEAPVTLAAAELPAPVRLAAAESSGGIASDAPKPGAPAPQSADLQAPAPQALAPQAPAAPAPAAPPAKADLADGHELFNGTCAHCHGPDAIQSERRINLRLLQHRYGERMDEVFLTTVTHGRPEKGMPNWSEVFTMDQFGDILAYLHSVQSH